MKGPRPLAIKLDQKTWDRLKRLTDATGCSPDWALHQAADQFLAREEAREGFLAAGLEAWVEYQVTGLHVSQAEADAWLTRLQAGELAPSPNGHS